MPNGDALIPRLARASRERLDEVAMLGRIGRDLPPALRRPLTLEQARLGIRERLASRERGFWYLMERTVFARPRSPYARLLRIAGCEPGDLWTLLQQEGLEGALHRLAEHGVYVAFDEVKGRREAIRGSQRFFFRDTDFDNPLVSSHFVSYTSGSRGRPNRVMRPLGDYESMAAFVGMTMVAHGIEQSRHLVWRNNPIDWLMMHALLGRPIVGWLHPERRPAWQIRYGARYLAAVGRLAGYQFPLPGFCDDDHLDRVARALAVQSAQKPPLVVNAVVSSAVRVAIEARRAGLELSGVTFILDSEPITSTRLDQLRAVGARVIANYGSIELNTLGFGCAAPGSPDDLHFALDRYALAERERSVQEGGPAVRALLFTSLLPFEPKIAVNMELGDEAEIEDRSCDCLLGDLGYRTHLSRIRSFEKLSGEGVTFVAGDLLHLFESTLPARFGGTSLDYQLVEEESPEGLARFVLRVSPTVGRIDEAALRETILAELGRNDVVARHHADLLDRAGTVRVLRQTPLVTRSGKVLPLSVAPRRQGSGR